jgi:hypothetical protein
MKARVVAVSVSTVALVAGAGLVAMNPADAHPSHAVIHTINLKLTETGNLNYNNTTSSSTDTAKIAGKRAGFDVAHFSGTSGDVALSLKGGLLYGHLKFNVNTGKITGSVTGGTGTYKGAKGTVSAMSTNQAGTKTSVTIKWHK